MRRIEIGHYVNPDDVGGWVGWVGSPRWIAFGHRDGRVLIYKREASGAVVGGPFEV